MTVTTAVQNLPVRDEVSNPVEVVVIALSSKEINGARYVQLVVDGKPVGSLLIQP